MIHLENTRSKIISKGISAGSGQYLQRFADIAKKASNERNFTNVTIADGNKWERIPSLI